MNRIKYLYPQNNAFLKARDTQLHNHEEILDNISRISRETKRYYWHFVGLGSLVCLIILSICYFIILLMIDILSKNFNISETIMTCFPLLLSAIGLYVGYKLLQGTWELILYSNRNEFDIFQDVIKFGEISTGQVLHTETVEESTRIHFYHTHKNDKQNNVTGVYITSHNTDLKEGDIINILHWNFVRIIL